MVWGDTRRFCNAVFSLWGWRFDRSRIQGTNSSKPRSRPFLKLQLVRTLGQYAFGNCIVLVAFLY